MQQWEAGEYRVASFATSSMRSQGGTSELELYFTVTPGVVQYLGEFHLELPNCISYRLAINDEFERDRGLLAERVPGVSTEHMVNRAGTLHATPRLDGG